VATGWSLYLVEEYNSPTYKKMKRRTLTPFDKSPLAYYQRKVVFDIEQSAPAASRLPELWMGCPKSGVLPPGMSLNIPKYTQFKMVQFALLDGGLAL
jgi:hypothetical protein